VVVEQGAVPVPHDVADAAGAPVAVSSVHAGSL
jgi:hypothetical protein